MTPTEQMMETPAPTNRFSYRSYSSNQIMSDLSKLHEEENFQYGGGKTGFDNLNKDEQLSRSSVKNSFDNLNNKDEGFTKSSDKTSFDNLNEAVGARNFILLNLTKHNKISRDFFKNNMRGLTHRGERKLTALEHIISTISLKPRV